MLRPCSSEIDDGLSLAGQCGGRGLSECYEDHIENLINILCLFINKHVDDGCGTEIL